MPGYAVRLRALCFRTVLLNREIIKMTHQHHPSCGVTAAEALRRLKEGNGRYAENAAAHGDVSEARRLETARKGQKPYAVVLCCSDSRSIPETVFSAGIGDLFVIRVAGNVVDDHQLGSIEYASEHLGVRLVVVLGHTHCGAVKAAINHDPEGYVKTITDEVKAAIGEETDDAAAAALNARAAVRKIEASLEIQDLEHDEGLRVLPAILDIETGRVTFIED